MVSSLLVAALAVASAAAVTPPMPAFIWSPNTGVLRSPNTEVTQSFSASDLASFIKYTAGISDEVPAELGSYLPSVRANPEMVLVFVQPKLNTAEVSRFGQAFDPISQGGAFTNLKGAIESSGSALSLPYVYRTEEMDLLSQLQETPNFHTVDAEDAPAYLHGKQWLMHDRKTDVLVVKFGTAGKQHASEKLRIKFADDDKLMAQILAKTDAATKGDFMAVMTANAPGHSLVAKRATAIAQEQAQLLQTKTRLKKASSSSQYLYTTPGILSGLLVSLVLLIILSIGIMAMMALDTPDSFEGEGGYLKGS